VQVVPLGGLALTASRAKYSMECMKGDNRMKNPVWAYIFRSKSDEPTLVELLSALPIFEGLSRTQIRGITRLLHERTYAKGETVFNETEPGAGLYIISSGRIAVTKQIEGGEQFELAEFVEGNFFGELALIDEIPRSATTTALETSTLLAFPKPDLDRLIERQPQLAVRILRNLARLVAQRLLQANRNLEELQRLLPKEG